MDATIINNSWILYPPTHSPEKLPPHTPPWKWILALVLSLGAFAAKHLAEIVKEVIHVVMQLWLGLSASAAPRQATLPPPVCEWVVSAREDLFMLEARILQEKDANKLHVLMPIVDSMMIS